jgi:ABC-2 type transport system permease protein
MLALFKKEIRLFLGSLIGYVVILTFLTLLSLFLWLFPGDFNILDAGFASMDSLFMIAPWVYLFLIPAITMRSFAEEKRTGTLELLLTKPLTDLQLILAKYFAGVALVFISILPTLVYYYSVHQLGSPAGNLDSGGIAGSYIGLLLLAAAFVSIGIFASALTDNQVVAFILAVFLCFSCYQGFESLSALPVFNLIENTIVKIGINYHYVSLSRGVIDTRDLIYFAGLSAVFILSTRTVLESRKW